MYKIILILIFLFPIKTFSQINEGYYIGYERMCGTNSEGKKECYGKEGKWYHKNNLLIRNDSVYIYKEPIYIIRKDTFYSTADGAFYYFVGNFLKKSKQMIISIILINCDYCIDDYLMDSITGLASFKPDTFNYPVYYKKTELIINSVKYNFQSNKSFPIEDTYLNKFFKTQKFEIDPTEDKKLINE